MALSKADKEYIEKKIKEELARQEQDSLDALRRLAHLVKNHVQGPLHRR